MTTKLDAPRRPVESDGRHPDFYVQTSALKIFKAADESEDGRPRLLATASSDAIDLEGDRFTKAALKQMKSGFKGKLAFLNHRYAVPEDVFGVMEDCTIVERENSRLDLDIIIAVETGNPRAMQVYGMIANGTRLGVSVGVIVLEWNRTEDEDDNGRKIVELTSVIALEASIVGIPANQTCWTQQAVKSLVTRGELELDEADVESRPWLKAAVAGHKPAKADPDMTWSASEAVKHLRTWAGGPEKENMSWTKYRKGFAWFNEESAESFGSYKMPHHDIVDDAFKTVWKGVVAAAVVVQGGRGGVSIPEGDMDGVKSHLGGHYDQFGETPPWEREKDSDWTPFEREVTDELIAVGLLNELRPFAETFAAEEPVERKSVMESAGEASHILEEAITLHQAHMDDPSTATAESQQRLMDLIMSASEEIVGDMDEDDDKSSTPPPAGGEEGAVRQESAAEGAATYEVCDQMVGTLFDGFFFTLDKLYSILMSTEMSTSDRRSAGIEAVKEAAFDDFLAQTWNDTIDTLEAALAESDEDESKELSEAATALARFQERVSQWDTPVRAGAALVADIAKRASAVADERDQALAALAVAQLEIKDLQDTIETSVKLLDAVFELPLGTITTREIAQGAQTLATRSSKMHPDIVARLEQVSARRTA